MSANGEILVVKYGSASVTNESGMDENRLAWHAEQLAGLHEVYDLIVVSSGSIAVGRALLERQGTAQDEEDLQSLATLGSGLAFTAWQTSLLRHDILAGQLLVTHREIDDVDEGSVMRRVLQRNIDKRRISIVNENDALSVEEIRRLSYGGDNDGLATHLAIALGASKLCLLTEAEGLLRQDGTIVRTVTEDTQVIVSSLLEKSNNKGKGGIESKVAAAQKAARHGIEAYIGHANVQVQAILDGLKGTYFQAASPQT